jgi:predicted short-subunit dehydrogenase-like oxidoreductase (DUF2520 family)
VRAVWLPPGVTAGQAQFDVGQHEVLLPIEASAGATLGTFPIALVASARVGNVVVEQALSWIDVQVVEPWLALARAEARGGVGGEIAATLPVTRMRPQHGPAPVVVTNLPRGVVCRPATLAADAEALQLVFDIAPDAAVGRHGAMTVEVRLPDGAGRPVLHRASFGELKVEAKKKPKGGIAAGGPP